MNFRRKIIVAMGVLAGLFLLGGVYYLYRKSFRPAPAAVDNKEQMIARNACVDQMSSQKDKQVLYVGCNGFF
jgi:hypothetical protein